MLPSKHIILGFVSSLVLFFIYPEFGFLGIAIIFLSSFLLDFDHYLYYIFKKRDSSLKRAYNYFLKLRDFFGAADKGKKYKKPILIFHGVEFFIVLVLLTFFAPLFQFVLFGSLIHISLDFIDSYINNKPIEYKISQIYNLIKNKNKKNLEI